MDKTKRGDPPPTPTDCADCRKVRAAILEAYIADQFGGVLALDTECMARFWVWGWDRVGVVQALDDLQDEGKITLYHDRSVDPPRLLITLVAGGAS